MKTSKENGIHISELQPDNKNFNKHTEFGMSLLEKSVRKFGMGRSILIDKNNRIIAGNGIAEIAGSVGIENVKVIETDGNEIIAVKRNDIDLESTEGREMALADNATSSANLQWDYKKIKEELTEGVAIGWAVDIGNGVNYNKEEDEGEILPEYPITILQSKEEYDLFVKIARMLGKNNMDTFSEILDFYKLNNKVL